jgi:hypothetical protein
MKYSGKRRGVLCTLVMIEGSLIKCISIQMGIWRRMYWWSTFLRNWRIWIPTCNVNLCLSSTDLVRICSVYLLHILNVYFKSIYIINLMSTYLFLQNLTFTEQIDVACIVESLLFVDLWITLKNLHTHVHRISHYRMNDLKYTYTMMTFTCCGSIFPSQPQVIISFGFILTV